MKRRYTALLVLLPLLISQSSRLVAQSRPTGAVEQTAEKASEAAPIKLSPFVVSTDKDTGYIAADTLNAGLLNTNLLMTPGGIDIFTRDFLNDIGATNIDEASGWLTSSRPLELGAVEGNSVDPGGLNYYDSGTNVSLRGLGANPSTRNYFASASTPKEYNVERVESARGPNAILYGEGGPGGGVNYITKRAKGWNFTTLRLRFDDDFSKGVSLDANRRLRHNLDVRYNLNLQDTRYYIDRTKLTEQGQSVTLTYSPFERTNVIFDADYSRNTRPSLIMNYLDRYSRWDHQPVTGKLSTSAATAKGLTNLTGSKYMIWTEGIGLLDYAGYATTNGVGVTQAAEAEFGDALFPSVAAASGAPGVSAVPTLPRNFNANPENQSVVDKATDIQLSIDHTFQNNLSLQLAGQYSYFTSQGGNYPFSIIYIDPLFTLPNGQNNPNYGKPLSRSHIGRRVDYTRESKSIRFVTAYPLKLFGGVTTFSAFAIHQEKNDTTIYTDLHIKDPSSTLPITDGASLIRVNRYLDNLPAKLPDFSALYDTVDVPTVDARNKQKTDAYEVAMSGNYLKDTLSIIAGYRRDRSELDNQNGVASSRDPNTGQFTSYATDSRLGFNDTTTYGFVYFPTKILGVYGNHSEGFIIQSAAYKRLDGSFSKANIVPAGEKAAGLRFQIGNNQGIKIIGSVGYYRAEQTNRVRNISIGNINILWNDLGEYDGKDYSSNYISTYSNNPLTITSLNSITSSSSLVGYGWEGSLTANFGKAFRLTINGALPKTKQSDVAADYVRYVNENRSKWQVLANNPSNPNNVQDTNHINQIQSFIDSFQEGRYQNYTYDYRANVFGVYTFTSGRLKGLRIGGGVQFYGPCIAGNEPGRPFDYVYAKKYHLASALIGYPINIGKYKADIQLNVSNLFDYDDPIVNGVFAYSFQGSVQNVPYGTKNIWPRLVRFTMNLPF
ncbi:MAG: hypothetical protein KBA71_00090 [Opitutaceae bacterium]|nr:hypothetical protein [Opitutaceae bacterium]